MVTMWSYASLRATDFKPSRQNCRRLLRSPPVTKTARPGGMYRRRGLLLTVCIHPHWSARGHGPAWPRLLLLLLWLLGLCRGRGRLRHVPLALLASLFCHCARGAPGKGCAHRRPGQTVAGAQGLATVQLYSMQFSRESAQAIPSAPRDGGVGQRSLRRARSGGSPCLQSPIEPPSRFPYIHSVCLVRLL